MAYEGTWDGYRWLLARHPDGRVEMRSRRGTALTVAFSDVAATAQRDLPAPHHTPHATQADVVEKILWLRQQYHFGPAKIALYLERYHDVKVSSSGVWRLLKKVGLNRLPASQRYKRRSTRWKRYEKQRPGHQLDKGIGHVRIRPRTPRLNGKADGLIASTPKSSTDSWKGR